jgi:hypothetical protein
MYPTLFNRGVQQPDELAREKMTIGTDRREYERFPCENPILHNTNLPDFFYKGTMCNFSEKGLYFESNEDLLKGHEISISIKKPPQKFTKKFDKVFDVKIIWYRELKGSSYQNGYGAKLI